MGFDINNFPTKVSAKRMLLRITDIYGKSYVGKWIFEVMGAEIDPAWDRVEELKQQAFPVTATWGLKYWEQRYGIYPDESIPIEKRRRKVLSYRMPRLPMNPVRMERILSAASGRKVEVKENIAPYTFEITIDGNSSIQVDLMDLFDLIEKIKPAHQSYRVAFVKNTCIFAGANLFAMYKPAAIIDGYSVEREAHQFILAGMGQYARYRPAAITDGYRIGRKIKPVVYTGMAIYQTERPAAIREIETDNKK